jgi:hypothetical protein
MRSLKKFQAALTVDERHAWTVLAALADALQIAVEELVAANLQTLLDDFGSILVHAVLGGEAQDVIDSAASISWCTVFADVLDAPVAKLAMSDDVDAGENFVDTGTLRDVSNYSRRRHMVCSPCLPQDSSRRCFGPRDCRSRREQPHATCHEVTR